MLKPRDLIALRQAVAERRASRARKARAMRPPDPAAMAYTRDLLAVMDAWQALVMERIRPELSVFEGSTSGVSSSPDNPESMVGVPRLDALPSRVAYTIQDLHSIIDTFIAEQGVGRLVDLNVGRVNEWTLKELSASLGIDVTASFGVGGLLEQFRTENVLKIKSYLGGSLQDMSNLLDRSVGVRVEDIASSIEAGFGVTRSRATLLARDQTLKMNAAVTQQRQGEVGVTQYIWVTSKDERVRGDPGGKWPVGANGGGDHYSLDGQTFSWIDPPITNTRTGARNHPGEDFQCRCTATPVLTGLLDYGA